MVRWSIIAIAIIVATLLKEPLAACFLMAGYEVGEAAGKDKKEVKGEEDVGVGL